MGKLKLKSLSRLIKEEKNQFGDEISKINSFVEKEYPDNDEFDWDGNELTVTFKDEDKADIILSREDLMTKIDGFPSGSLNESIMIDDRFLYRTAFPTISANPNAKVIITSTPRGMNNFDIYDNGDQKGKMQQ